MMKYIINISGLVFSLLLTASLISFPCLKSAHAQYHGYYPGQQIAEEKNKTTPIIPQIFSSQVSSVQQAKKIDVLYNTLYVSLWNYAMSDVNYQKKLYNLISSEHFQTTRYMAEFSETMNNAMVNLNENYKKLHKNIDAANREYLHIKETIRLADYDVLDKLWSEKIAEYEQRANNYFKMQHEFLNTYRALVAFIIKQGGGYYYDTSERSVKFFKFGAYEYFAKALDKLYKLTYEQKKLLKLHVPATEDLLLLE
ncbi:MAG: hypothetical protein KAJ40_07485 [Alphaproteobacteria bacterium]|nr:hypothetical protein [Alphaproteobacteria bacterium]